jgi:hypothetical protein
MEKIRKITETCDHLSTFEVFSAINGGAGSGYTSKLVDLLETDYPGEMVVTFNLFPSK